MVLRNSSLVDYRYVKYVSLQSAVVVSTAAIAPTATPRSLADASSRKQRGTTTVSVGGGYGVYVQDLQYLIVWNMTTVVTFYTAQYSSSSSSSTTESRAAAINQALNASLYSGQLERSIRTASGQTPTAASLLSTVVCTSNNATACLMKYHPLPPIDTQTEQQVQQCSQASGAQWDELYNLPRRFPWYTLWLIALTVVWIVLLLLALVLLACKLGSAEAVLRSIMITVLCSCVLCSLLRIAYVALMLGEYYLVVAGSNSSSSSSSSGNNNSLYTMSCIEFSFVAATSAIYGNAHFTAAVTLLRTLFYPALLSLCKLTMYCA